MAAFPPIELGAPDVTEVDDVEVEIKRDGIPELDIAVTAKDKPVDTAEACNDNGWNSTPVVNLKYSFKVNWPQRIPLRHVRRQFAELEQALQDAGVTFSTGVHVCFVASTIYIQSLITTLVFNIRTRSTSGP